MPRSALVLLLVVIGSMTLGGQEAARPIVEAIQAPADTSASALRGALQTTLIDLKRELRSRDSIRTRDSAALASASAALENLKRSYDEAMRSSVGLSEQLKKLRSDSVIPLRSNLDRLRDSLRGVTDLLGVIRLEAASLKKQNEVLAAAGDDARAQVNQIRTQTAQEIAALRDEQRKDSIDAARQRGRANAELQRLSADLSERRKYEEALNDSLHRQAAAIAVTQEELKNRQAALDSLHTRLEDNRGWFRVFMLTVILGLLSLLVVAGTYYRRVITSDPWPIVGAVNKTSASSGFEEIQSLVHHGRGLSWLCRRGLLAGLAFACVTALLIAGALAAHPGDYLQVFGAEEFWKTIGAMATPLVFVVTAYNIVESRRLEAAKTLAELYPKDPKPMAFELSELVAGDASGKLKSLPPERL